MNQIEKMERKREAQRRLRAQRQRTGRLRSRVVAISLIAFVVLWGVVFAQMATGNDPVLSNSSSARPSGAAEAVSAATEAIETSAPEEVESEVVEPEPVEEEPIEAEPEPEPAPVTTSQS